MKKWIWIAVPACLFLSSCDEGENDNLAKAQACLNAVPQSDPARAENCMQYIASNSSQQAKIIKCGIKLTSGGLVESKMVRAAQLLSEANVSNPEAVYMSVFALDNPDISTGYAKAVEANTFCQGTGVAGFQYISNVVLMGSTMAKMMGDLSIPVDLTDPTSVDPDSVEQAVKDLMSACNVTNPPANCQSNFATLGQAAGSLSQSYCNSSSADSNVCAQIQSAVGSTNGTSAQIGQALLCYLDGKTFNGTQCVP